MTLTLTSIRIICRPLPTKTLIMVSRPLYWADKQLMLHVAVTLDLLTQKSIGIINRPTKTPIKVSLSLIDFKLLSRQGLPDEGHCDLDLYPTDPKKK